MKTGAEETGDVDVVWRGGGVYGFLYERAYLPQPFSKRPCASMYVGSNFSKNLTVCTRQELCLSSTPDDTTTCFGFSP